MLGKLRSDTPRNRTLVGGLLALASVTLGLLGSLGAEASIGHLLTLIITWAAALVTIAAGFIWMRASGHWEVWIAVAGFAAGGAGVAAVLWGRPPVGLAAFVLIGVSFWLAKEIEADHRVRWVAEQEAVAARQARVRAKSADVVVQEGAWEDSRERERWRDSDTEYPATLREFKSRRLREEGDPFSGSGR